MAVQCAGCGNWINGGLLCGRCEDRNTISSSGERIKELEKELEELRQEKAKLKEELEECEFLKNEYMQEMRTRMQGMH